MNTTHPEIREGEIFITNIHADFMYGDGFNKINWKTKRKGNVAYTTDGRIDKDGYPVFIQLKEYEAKFGKVDI